MAFVKSARWSYQAGCCAVGYPVVFWPHSLPYKLMRINRGEPYHK
ncbi:hypothetical protein AB4Z22_01595 [Paenibacillus sp. TAF58]